MTRLDVHYANGTIVTLEGASQPPAGIEYVGWRCLHNPEGGYQSDNGMPEIRPTMPNSQPVLFTKELQLLSYELMLRRNPTIRKNQWRSTYGNTTAFTNGNGFNKSGDPRADYINLRDLSSPLPKLMKALICGGMFIRGVVGYSVIQAMNDAATLVRGLITRPRSFVGHFRANFSVLTTNNVLRCYPGVHGLDANKQITSIEGTLNEVLEKNWYFHAVTQDNGKMFNFPQGNAGPVLIPYVLREVVSYPLWYFTPWNSERLPNHLAVGG